MPPQNPHPDQDQHPLQASSGQPLQPVPPPAAQDPSPRPVQEVQTSSHGDVEINHAPGQLPQYSYQAAQPLQPLPELQHDQHPSQLYPAGKPADKDASPYDFFLESKPAAKTSKIPGLSKLPARFTKALIVLAVVIIGLMAAAVIFGGNKSSDGDSGGTLSSVINQQQEIIRVGNLAQSTVQSSNLRNFTVTTISALTSDQQKLISYANSRGAKIDSKALAAASGDSKIDAALAAAQAASTYDSTYQATMKQLLADYQANIQRVRGTSTTATTQSLLGNELSSAALLQTMLLTN